MKLRILAAAATAAALLSTAPSAHAASVAWIEGDKMYVIGDSQANDITARRLPSATVAGQRVGADVFEVVDTVGIFPGEGCVAVSATSVTCTSTGVLSELTMRGEPGNDRLYVDRSGPDLTSQYPVRKLYGDAGNDIVTTGPDTVTAPGWRRSEGYGGTGDDTLNSVNAPAYLVGGAGNDRIYAGGTMDNEPLDMYRHVPITGIGSIVYGDVGNTPTATDGHDTITTWGADQWLRGGGGNDTITGWFGEDTLLGDTGNDTLTGGSGEDSIYGDAGDDQLVSSDSWYDDTNCGLGTDRVRHDQHDWVYACEIVQ